MFFLKYPLQKILKLINNKNYDFMLLKVKNMLKFIKIKQG